MVSLELNEFESATVARGMLSGADVAVLQRYHGQHLSLTTTAGGYHLEARSSVGVVRFPGGSIRVRPKVPVANLLTMLLYGHDLVHLRGVTGSAANAADSLYELLVVVLVAWVERLIKGGLYREYLPREEALAGVRGKIIPHLSRLREGRTHCVYGELGYSTPLNIIIKATLLWVLSRDISRTLKMRARSLVRLLGQVATKPLSAASFRHVQFSRLNVHYRRIVGLCRSIYSASVYDENGPQEFSGYMVSMEQLFEAFLFGAISRAFDGVTKQSKRDAWAGGDTQYLPSIVPDIVIRDRLIIDAKYYRGVLADNGKVRSAHIYQMHTYLHALGLDGVLVYPLAENEAASLPVRFNLPGGRTLWVVAIDLARVGGPGALAQPLIDSLQAIVGDDTEQAA